MTGNKEILELGSIIENLIHQKGLLNNKWSDFVNGPADINDKWTVFEDLIKNELLSVSYCHRFIKIGNLDIDIDLDYDLGLNKGEGYDLLRIYDYILEGYPSLDGNIVKDSIIKKYWNYHEITVC